MRSYARYWIGIFALFSFCVLLVLFPASNPASSKEGPAPLLTEAPGSFSYLPIVNDIFCSNCFFVDSERGSDQNPGRPRGQAWRTIQKAANTLKAGETVTVLPGNYNERVQVTRSGASGAPIAFQAEGAVSLKGFTVRADYITVKGFEISNTEDIWDDGWGIFVEGSYCLVEANYVHYATRGGIILWTPPGEGSNTSHCTVRNNRLYRNAKTGIDVYGRGNLIEGNEIWGTIQYHPKRNDPPAALDADGIWFFGSGHTIRRNYIHDISFRDPENVDPHIDCFQTFADSNHEAAQNIILEKNYCRNLESQTENENGKGFMIQGASQITVQNNLIQAFFAIMISESNEVRVINNTFAYDLTIPSEYNSLVLYIIQSPNSTAKNNIFYDYTGSIYMIKDNLSRQGLDIGYNCVYRSDGRSPYGDPYPHDLWNANPRFANPQANNFHLRADSPCVDAGAAIASIKEDYENVPRPQGRGYDIGAYER